jgi:hypothetical protein
MLYKIPTPQAAGMRRAAIKTVEVCDMIKGIEIMPINNFQLLIVLIHYFLYLKLFHV